MGEKTGLYGFVLFIIRDCLLTGNVHQLPKHGCVIGLRLPIRGRVTKRYRYGYIGTLASEVRVSFVC